MKPGVVVVCMMGVTGGSVGTDTEKDDGATDWESVGMDPNIMDSKLLQNQTAYLSEIKSSIVSI